MGCVATPFITGFTNAEWHLNTIVSWRPGARARAYASRHPRLEPSIAPMSRSAEANAIPFITAEFLAQAEAMGLRGKAKTRYVEEKVAEARESFSGAQHKEK